MLVGNNRNIKYEIGENIKMNFKEQLKGFFKSVEASPLLFIGSGISKRYINSESWDDLLKRFCNLMGENYVKLKSQSNGDLPTLAGLLAAAYSEKWWGSEIKGSKDEEYAHHLIKSDSPLKIEISNYLREIHKNLNEEMKKEVDLLKSAKIDGIITTNWDLFLNSLFPEFTVYIGQDGLIGGRTHGVAEIYKIHGCCTDPNSLVLTDKDYEKFRRKNPYLSSKLLTLFIEHPIIFLGYSLSDPHILEILEEIVQCFPADKLDVLRKNIVFVEWDPAIGESKLTESLLLKKLPVNLIKTSTFSDLFQVLSEFKRRIPAHVFRQIKDELYDLVVRNDPKGQLYVKDVNDLIDGGSVTEFVVGYGAISAIKKPEKTAKRGIIGIDRYDLVRDIIFDTGEYDPQSIVFDAFPVLLRGKAYTPVFKYVAGAGLIDANGNIETKGMCEGLIDRLGTNLDRFRAHGFEARRSENIPEVRQGVNELYGVGDFNLFLRMVVFVPEELINIEDLLEILKTHVDEVLQRVDRSQFIKIVCMYDYLRYGRPNKT